MYIIVKQRATFFIINAKSFIFSHFFYYFLVNFIFHLPYNNSTIRVSVMTLLFDTARSSIFSSQVSEVYIIIKRFTAVLISARGLSFFGFAFAVLCFFA